MTTRFAQIFSCSFSYSCSAFEFRTCSPKADCGLVRRSLGEGGLRNAVNVPVNVNGFWLVTLVAAPRPPKSVYQNEPP
ncbi:hypothetical protein AMJ85_02560 [candidate division BRC1 bacterium SM23_51]|nr:MAG: hypothetical protein AMJ85_02560 [candidate division BRC1 bacterium SM23_51]